MFYDKVYYEPAIFDYELGRELKGKFDSVPWIEIDSHNSIEELRSNPNSKFPQMKRHLIIGVRKTHKYVPNHKVSDFLVPYTSSGCSAMCLYCYLVCNYNKCAYLRLFVNREQMLDKIVKHAQKSDREYVYEIGSNSDLVLENTLTGNLEWTIEEFAKSSKGKLTFPTKFDMVDSLLSLNHNGKIIMRMSVNPHQVIQKIEIGTSPLSARLQALNKMCDAGYPVGILIAPVIIMDDWKELYSGLIRQMAEEMSDKVKREAVLEIIFMTYSYVHNAINEEAFPNAVTLYDKNLMTGRGRGKYCYRQDLRAEGEVFLREEITKYLPGMEILYVI